MSKLHASITYQHGVNEVEAIHKQKSTENIIGPIITTIVNNNLDLEINETDIQELNNNIEDNLDLKYHE